MKRIGSSWPDPHPSRALHPAPSPVGRPPASGRGGIRFFSGSPLPLGEGLGVRVLLLALLTFGIASGVAHADEAKVDPAAAKAPEKAMRFIEVGEQAGARIVHSTRSFGDRPKAQVLEMFTDGGAASAVADFDGDGDDDIFVVDSGEGRPHHLCASYCGGR